MTTAARGVARRGFEGFIKQSLKDVPHNSRVLMVGSGGGIEVWLREALQGKNAELVRTDIDPDRKPDVVDDITASQFPDESFNAIVIMEVLEHVTQPFAAVAELHRLLRPGGLLVMSTPFFVPLHDRPHDYFRFTRYGLALLLSRFEDVKVVQQNGWSEALLIAGTRVYKEKTLGALAVSVFVVPLCLLLTPVAMLMDKLTRTDFLTTTYFTTAVRPRS